MTATTNPEFVALKARAQHDIQRVIGDLLAPPELAQWLTVAWMAGYVTAMEDQGKRS